jgi:nitrate/nitrite transport system ATP-binding protein
MSRTRHWPDLIRERHACIIERTAAGFPRSKGCQGLRARAKPVFADVSFGIDRGEFVCIIGHSGCGKTTILNVLAGLDTASGGHVFMDGREVAGPSLERGVVFQGHALMPWLTVRRTSPSPSSRAGPSGAAPGQCSTWRSSSRWWA